MHAYRSFAQPSLARGGPEPLEVRDGGPDGGLAGVSSANASSNDGRPRAGVSAFRCKGNVYIGMLEHLARTIPGGIGAVLRGTRDQEMAEFASQRFLAASWYDAMPMVGLGEAAASAVGIPFARLMAAVGTAQAERDIRGIYKYLLHFASPAAIVERLPRVARQYFDFVTSELLTRPARSPSSLLLTGLPQCLAPTYAVLTEPFLRRALTLSGAKDVEIEISPFESDDWTHGAPAVRFTRTITWS